MPDTTTLPLHMSCESIADRLTQIRAHYTACIAAHESDLPHSATAEEIAATRALNNLILDLSAKPKNRSARSHTP